MSQATFGRRLLDTTNSMIAEKASLRLKDVLGLRTSRNTVDLEPCNSIRIPNASIRLIAMWLIKSQCNKRKEDLKIAVFLYQPCF
jgi:hypothetical protein